MLIPLTMRPSVYQVLVSLMDGALSDLVTRFTSAESLKDCTIPIPIPIAIALVATTNSKL